MIGLLVDFWLGCNVTGHASPTAPEALHG
jgi:hypothetical protein